jgi:hypothetical protein
VGFDDFLNTPGVHRAVVLLERHGEPVTFRQFTELTGLADLTASKLRDAMQRFGLISVAWANERTQRIELTAHGRKLVLLVAQEGKLVEDAMRARKPDDTR